MIDKIPYFSCQWSTERMPSGRFQEFPLVESDEIPTLCWVSRDLKEYFDDSRMIPFEVVARDLMADTFCIQRLDRHTYAYHRMVADYWRLYRWVLPRARATLSIWGLIDIPRGQW